MSALLIPGPWYVAWKSEPAKIPYVSADKKANVWTDGPYLDLEAAGALAALDGFAGVGVYPTSGFVHVDVRDRSWFWIDKSGPGRKNRARGVLGDVAKRSDELAFALVVLRI